MAAQGPRTSNDTLIREGGMLDLRSSHDPSAFHIGLANTRASTISLSLVHPALASGPVRRWVVSSRMPSTGGGGGYVTGTSEQSQTSRVTRLLVYMGSSSTGQSNSTHYCMADRELGEELRHTYPHRSWEIIQI